MLLRSFTLGNLLASSAMLLVAGCGSGEPSPQDKARAKADYEKQMQKVVEDPASGAASSEAQQAMKEGP